MNLFYFLVLQLTNVKNYNMPKRRRLFTPIKQRNKYISQVKKEDKDLDYETEVAHADSKVNLARCRLKGALRLVLDPSLRSDESESSRESSPVKRERSFSRDKNEQASDADDFKKYCKTAPQQSYVLKLFDRSVDLSQFTDDSPLYPICRAWMANQPKANYKKSEQDSKDDTLPGLGVELPGPEGAPVPKVPPLLPEQRAADKNNINLNYREAAPPARQQLLAAHLQRWAAVKHAWQTQILLKEARYEGTQRVLNQINLEYQRQL